jgi:hypothetical protein
VADHLLELGDVPIDLVAPVVDDLGAVLAIGAEEGPEDPVDVVVAVEGGDGGAVEPAGERVDVADGLEAALEELLALLAVD